MRYHNDLDPRLRRGIVALLEVKDSDIRILSLQQCRTAVDRSIHIGGAFSATIPLVALHYGGIIEQRVDQPTAPGQDLFVLSKGHAVATLASIYADLGYFPMEVLENSRSVASILNGHPGPLLPGVHLATGPMGQGLGVAQGFAIAGRRAPEFDVYAITGDGELQEGPIWESVMYAGYQRLENLCVLVDHNGGQLDDAARLHFPYHDLAGSFRSFGWRAVEVDATRMHTVLEALADFKHGRRDGRPTAIICNATKGHGGFSSFMNSHKVTIPEALLDQEIAAQEAQRSARIQSFCQLYDALTLSDDAADIARSLEHHAASMGYEIVLEDSRATSLRQKPRTVRITRAPARDKRIRYDAAALPRLERGKSYGANTVVDQAMRVFARDPRVVSIDSDLASTSGLQGGVGFVDKGRALNVGVAEANMMLIGEAFAILGYNAWISTFCPFYDLKVLRRIAVGHQERLEVMAAGGWLSEGHGVDLAMLATAADLETQANGATHMGNDDALILAGLPHVKIINVSCPQQLLAVMRWVMEGNRGLVYIRVLRAPAPVIYDADFEFDFGRAYTLRRSQNPRATVITSGRCVHEALAAADRLSARGIDIEVVDMPSVDAEAILGAYHSGRPVFIAEQNNGYLWQQAQQVLFASLDTVDTRRLHPINTTGGREPHYIHSGTYAELAALYDLDAAGLVRRITAVIGTA